MYLPMSVASKYRLLSSTINDITDEIFLTILNHTKYYQLTRVTVRLGIFITFFFFGCSHIFVTTR